MIEPSSERRAYFASLSTPDLIVCASVERSSFNEQDLELIRAELERRGVDADRLVIPGGVPAGALGPTPDDFGGPLPTVSAWWSEGWGLFRRHLAFILVIALVLYIPERILSWTLGAFHRWDLSVAAIAHAFLWLAFDTLLTAAVVRGLCRRMTTGHCSAGRALSLGINRWSWVFINALKALAIAVGLPAFLFALGRATDEGGPVALGIILLIYPGSYLLLRYLWVPTITALNPKLESPLKESRRLSTGLYSRLYGFLLLYVVAAWGVALAALITEAFLPGRILEELASGYLFAVFAALIKVILLVGYLHLRASSSAAGTAGAPLQTSGAELPPPPTL